MVNVILNYPLQLLLVGLLLILGLYELYNFARAGKSWDKEIK
jgi:hypothetical protein